MMFLNLEHALASRWAILHLALVACQWNEYFKNTYCVSGNTLRTFPFTALLQKKNDKYQTGEMQKWEKGKESLRTGKEGRNMRRTSEGIHNRDTRLSGKGLQGEFQDCWPRPARLTNQSKVTPREQCTKLSLFRMPGCQRGLRNHLIYNPFILQQSQDLKRSDWPKATVRGTVRTRPSYPGSCSGVFPLPSPLGHPHKGWAGWRAQSLPQSQGNRRSKVSWGQGSLSWCPGKRERETQGDSSLRKCQTISAKKQKDYQIQKVPNNKVGRGQKELPKDGVTSTGAFPCSHHA